MVKGGARAGAARVELNELDVRPALAAVDREAAVLVVAAVDGVAADAPVLHARGTVDASSCPLITRLAAE